MNDNTPLEDEFDDAIQLLGLPVDSPRDQLPMESPAILDGEPSLLNFRDTDIPGRDYQPRLFRFGDAA